MNLIYSDHATDMMQLRHISFDDVEACLKDHDIYCTDRAGNHKYWKSIDGRDIKVVLSKQVKNLVITVED